jgi:hypothetical protein
MIAAVVHFFNIEGSLHDGIHASGHPDVQTVPQRHRGFYVRLIGRVSKFRPGYCLNIFVCSPQ